MTKRLCSANRVEHFVACKLLPDHAPLMDRVWYTEEWNWLDTEGRCAACAAGKE